MNLKAALLNLIATRNSPNRGIRFAFWAALICVLCLCLAWRPVSQGLVVIWYLVNGLLLFVAGACFTCDPPCAIRG